MERRIGEARKPGPPGDVDDPNAAFDVDEYDCVDIESSHGLLSQPEVELSVTINSALTRSLEQRSFVPAGAFRGARPGAVFKTGEQGLGYYLDANRGEADTGAPTATGETSGQAPPVIIALADLLCVDIEVAEPRRTRRRTERV